MRTYYCECCNEISVTKEQIIDAINTITSNERSEHQPVHTDNWEEILLKELFE